ncbi:MAG: response regulator [Pleurocapsa sp.]
MIKAVSNAISNSQKSNVVDQLIYLKKREFSGRFEIQSSAKFSWSFYFYLGRLVGCDGGHHGNRCLRRQLLKYCSRADIENLEIEIDLHNIKPLECQTYHLLVSLSKQKLIQREEAIKIIQGQIQDILFDILQQENFGTMHYRVDAEFDNSVMHFNLHDALTLVNVEHILKQSHQDWINWIEAGLEYWSPNFAPKIRKKQSLQTMVTPTVYHNFTHFFNGQLTLRDLAWTMNKDLLLLIRSLAPYIRQGIISLIEVPDIRLPNSLSIQKQILASKATNNNRPLIVCIDDSKQVCQTMKSVLTQANYDFYDITEAIQAVPTLISKKPDLIFLDIGMPIMNGYEVCTQIKRVSQLKDIPLVMLTGKDGILDRMRAKVVGATAFMSKPIDQAKILDIAKELITDKLKQNQQDLTPALDVSTTYRPASA